MLKALQRAKEIFERRGSKARKALFIVYLCLLGAGAALIVLEPWNILTQPIEFIQVDKIRIPTTKKTRSKELTALARARVNSKVTLRGPEGFTYVSKWVDLGASVDFGTIDRLTASLNDKDSPAARGFKRYGKGDVPTIPLPVYLSSEQAVEALLSLKEIINRAPKNASFDFEGKSVITEKDGLLLDVFATIEKLDEALAKSVSEVEMVVKTVKPQIARADLEGIDVNNLIGFFETPYSKMLKDKDRTYNVKLGSAMLTGQVVIPGQVFSFNDVLGNRNEARGFRYAPVIEGGVLVEGMGGGTCQVASTLYAAAFFAGLVVVDRRPHSRPSSYTKLGLDATVSFPDIDLKLKNPFDFPVTIRFIADNGTLRAEILGKERPFTVTFLRRVVSETPFAVKTVDDPNVVKGKEVITQIGTPGYTVKRYQLIERDKIAYRFQTMDKYPPTTRFIHRGIGEPEDVKKLKDPPKPDSHDPYIAKPYLRMVQGPDNLWYEQSHE